MADILSALANTTVLTGPINTMEQIFQNPQIQQRGMQVTPEGIPGVRVPWGVSDAELKLDKTAPTLPKKD